MAFSYNNLWKLLEKKDMTKEDLKKATGMSSATIAKLSKNENINMKSLEKICEVLECNIEDIIEYIRVDERSLKYD
ncbi:helix-turn-helix domain-containing protein [Senegalia massiliensis]|uniref:helix-turn-helix domain-containing protein n=1 Tax=Senegalia massiliensis TaxID=1720316 RepID=UPI00103246CB|nr:helix-turn-helix transcriptional regulator [Senegalia massiliensis]